MRVQHIPIQIMYQIIYVLNFKVIKFTVTENSPNYFKTCDASISTPIADKCYLLNITVSTLSNTIEEEIHKINTFCNK